jgi:quinolinate synthase
LNIPELQEKTRELAKERNAILLVHNYQLPEIQEIADFIGDSLELCQRAQNVEAETIVFCGVDFMAETASILNPDKTVIHPNLKATCPMAAMLPMNTLKKAKQENPGIPAVLYVNTLAEAKAEADITCTSANTVKIIKQLGANKVLFGPDKNLAYYAQQRVPEVEIIPIPEDGHCYIHRFIGKGEEALQLKTEHPGSELIVHPECLPELQDQADHVLSTGGMYRHCRDSDIKTFIIGTEIGMLERLRREIKGKTYLPAKQYAECAAMKRITLENTYQALQEMKPVVKITPKIAKRARRPIELMLKMSL